MRTGIQMSEAKRHHYVPRFYLRRFADQKDRLIGHRKSTDKSVQTSSKNVAVETGFYSVEVEGVDGNVVEDALAVADSETAGVLARLDKSGLPISDDDRVTLAVFIALQLVRTKHHRATTDMAGSFFARLNSKMMTKEQVRAAMEDMGEKLTDAEIEAAMEQAQAGLDDYEITLNSEYVWGLALETAMKEMVPRLLDRQWHMFEAKSRAFVTSDHPIAYRRNKPDPFSGIGLETADEVWFPIDSQHLLVLARPDTLPDERVIQVTPAQVKDINSMLASWAYDWVFHDPRIAPFKSIGLPKQRPLAYINQTPIHGHEDIVKAVREMKDWNRK